MCQNALQRHHSEMWLYIMRKMSANFFVERKYSLLYSPFIEKIKKQQQMNKSRSATLFVQLIQLKNRSFLLKYVFTAVIVRTAVVTDE